MSTRLCLLSMVFFALISACSQDYVPGGCPEGTVPCSDSCVPAGTSCAPPDFAMPDFAMPDFAMPDFAMPDINRGDPSLLALSASTGTFSPAFSPNTLSYSLVLPFRTPSVTLAASAAEPGATILIGGERVASGSSSQPIALSSGVIMVTVSVQASGGASRSYTLAIIQVPAHLKASNSGVDDCFGDSVSLSGDTLAVGAYFESSSATGVDGNQADNSAPTSGAVYVFVRSGTTWSQQAYLKASNTGAQTGSAIACHCPATPSSPGRL